MLLDFIKRGDMRERFGHDRAVVGEIMDDVAVGVEVVAVGVGVGLEFGEEVNFFEKFAVA